MSAPRYAIYFVPAADTPLYRMGSSVLGYDCRRAHDVVFPPGLPMAEPDWRALTAAPRLYGFHATLKAPFSLNAGHKRSGLESALQQLARAHFAPLSFKPIVSVMDGFAAIVPAEPYDALIDLAARCVAELDVFRAPLGEAERARRLASGLNASQIANLDRWGYPFVFDEFRFHMTLTGAVGSDGPVIRDYLQTLLNSTHGADRMSVDRLVLVEQPNAGLRFRVIYEAELGTQ